jgi:hypothetical protein
MNSLPPDLKRLMEWSQKADPTAPTPMPPGFATRVLARRNDGINAVNGLGIWQRILWAWAWAAVVVILAGGVVLASQRGSPFDLNAAYQVVSIQFVP